MPYNRKAMGIIISRLRQQKNLTQEAFSARAGIARSHLTMLENGCKTLRMDTLFGIAEALDMQPSALVRLLEEATAE